MRFEWDESKARRNDIKHDVSFELAKQVFDDERFLTYPDRVVKGEERWHTLGMIQWRPGALVVFLVVHTVTFEEDEEVIRIISARKATRRERRFYEENK